MTHHLQLIQSRCRDTFAAVDWGSTSLGPVENWSQALRHTVQLCLNSQFPMTLAWGPDLNIIYNDGYLPILGSKHPASYGAPGEQVYAEIWDGFLASRLEQVLSGEVVWEENMLLPLMQDGVLKEFYFTFCYSPVPGDTGTFDGLISVAAESTATVLVERRSGQQTVMGTTITEVTSYEDILQVFGESAEANEIDCRCWALVEIDASHRLVTLAGSNDLAASTEQLSCAERDIKELASDAGWLHADIRTGSLDKSLLLLLRPDPMVVTNADFYAHLDRLQRMIDSACLKLDKTQRAVGERDMLYRMLFQHSADAILMTSPEGTVYAANPSACRLLGRSEAELQEGTRELVVDIKNPAVAAAIAERRATGYFSGDLEVVSKDGPVLCEVTSVIFPYENGEERAMLVFRSAEERQREEEERRTSARLEAIGQLTGGVAHDFNNLLQVIIGGTDELLKLVDGDQQLSKYVNMTYAAALKASDLTSQLLTFSSRQALAPRAINLTELVSQMDQILQRALGERIRVHINLSADAPVLLDVSLAQSAILNIALNAKDAMPAGGVLGMDSRRVRLADEQALALACEPGDYIAIDISDTGAGIPAADLKRVVEPFFTTKSPQSGTGLGLSMVFGFVRQSGGALDIVSEVGVGTTVTLYFPVTSMPVESAVEDPAKLHSGDGELVLIVEDNPMVANMLTEILRINQFRVEHFSTGEDALEYLATDAEAAFLISDVILGEGMDGWDVINACRRLRPSMKVALMSGFPGEHSLELENVNVPLLAKPFRANDVVALISGQLGSES